MEEGSLSQRFKSPDIPLAILFLVLTAAFSFYNLGKSSLWVDEAYSSLFSGLPWNKLLEAARIDGVNPPLYYILVKFMVGIFGSDEAGLRALSALANLVGLGAALALSYRLGGKAGMIVGGWFWAAHPMTLWYARDARPYALAAALGMTLMLAFILREDRPPSRTWVVATTLLIAAGFITHYFFFVLVAALTLIRIIRLRKRPDLFREWALMLLVAILPLALWIIWYLQQAQPSLGIGWIPVPVLGDMPQTLWNLLSGYAGVSSLAATVFGLISLALVGNAIWKSPRWSLAHEAAVFGVLAPVLAVWTISQRRPVYVDRYFIVLLPFIIVMLSLGTKYLLAWLSQRSVQQTALATTMSLLLIGSGLWSAIQVHTDPKFEHEDWRGLVAQQNAWAEDYPTMWLMEPEAHLPLSYYGLADFNEIEAEDPQVCRTACLLVLRQPYTPTHAFTQSVSDGAWKPEVYAGCVLDDRWDSPTGIALWGIRCGDG
jgi:uncharacterized membrane protein